MEKMQNKIKGLHVDAVFCFQKSVVLLCLLLLPAILKANIAVVFADDTQKTFKTKTIDGLEYLSLKQASEILFHGRWIKIYENSAVADSNYMLAFNNCFFVDIFNEGERYVIQMLMPAIIREQIVYLSSNDFVSALIANEVIAGTYKDNKLLFHKYSFAQIETYDFDTYANPFDVNSGKILRVKDIVEDPYENVPSLMPQVIDTYTAKKLQVDLPAMEPDYNMLLRQRYQYRKSKEKLPPSVYQIPDNVKRAQSDSKKNQDGQTSR